MNVLYDHAARNWGHHAHEASTELRQSILDLLKNEAKVSSFSQAMMAPKDVINYSQIAPRQTKGVHVAAYFGLKEVMIALHDYRYNLNLKDIYGQTPLLFAAWNGHEAVVKLLLAKEGVDLNSKDCQNQTPLLWAAKSGNKAVVKLLLAKEGFDPDSKDEENRAILLWAAENGLLGMRTRQW